jgi:threonine synthase
VSEPQSHLYRSTRGGVVDAPFDRALLEGLAPDGGLYLPQAWPDYAASGLVERAASTPYKDVCAEAIAPFVGPALPSEAVSQAAAEAAASFSHPDVTPLVEIAPGLHLLELFHGPTLAFKDCAMQLIAPLTREALRARQERLLLLCATSGDTGAAAVRAFANADRVDLVVLHPKGRVSDAQRRQMTTCDAPNVLNLAVRGDFDDCQRILKALTGDARLAEHRRVSTVNSINWVRLAGQIPYYLRTVSQLAEPAHFVVPTGNLGDAFAGWVARRCGAQMASMTAAVNSNDALARALETGRYERRAATPTASVAMDVQAPSNLERLIFEASGGDAEATRTIFETFAKEGAVQIPEPIRHVAAGDLAAVSVSEAETAQTIAETYKATGRVICPHTAVAMSVARRMPVDGAPKVVLATAHPGKFPESVGAALGRAIDIPEALAGLADLPEHMTEADPEIDAVRDVIERRLAPA